jgi:hypothetical protein
LLPATNNQQPICCYHSWFTFLPEYPPMETNALSAKLADLRQRVDALRGFL